MNTPMAAGGFQNIAEAQGVAIAITGMVIVFSALALISFFIASLPRLLTSLADVLPDEPETVVPQPEQTTGMQDFSDPRVVAAIAVSLHEQRRPQPR